jgi:hypothetical protein
MKVRKRPVVVDAFQWAAGPDQTEDPDWIVSALMGRRSTEPSKDARPTPQVSEKVKAAVKALLKERQLSDEQVNRPATL